MLSMAMYVLMLINTSHVIIKGNCTVGPVRNMHVVHVWDKREIKNEVLDMVEFSRLEGKVGY